MSTSSGFVSVTENVVSPPGTHPGVTFASDKMRCANAAHSGEGAPPPPPPADEVVVVVLEPPSPAPPAPEPPSPVDVVAAPPPPAEELGAVSTSELHAGSQR